MKPLVLLITILAGSIALSACSKSNSKSTQMSNNPLFSPSSLPFEAPDFNAIEIEHFPPAFEAGMEQELEEIKTVASNPEPPTFENTIVAMEKSGDLLRRTSSVFYNLASANTKIGRASCRERVGDRAGS